MSFEGMDPEAVAGVADALAFQAGVLDQTVATVDLAIRSALQVWPGDDAEDFYGWWTNQHRPSLRAAAEATHTATEALRRQVTEQLVASDMGPGGPAGGAGGPGGSGASGQSPWLGASGSVAGLSVVGGVITLIDAKGQAHVYRKEGSFQGGSGSYRVNGDGSVTFLGVNGSAKGTIDRTGVHLNADGSVKLVEVKGNLHQQLGIVSSDLAGSAFVGADARAGLTLDGHGVHAGGEAFAGARAQLSQSVEVGPVGAEAKVEGWAGAGVKAEGEATFEDGKIHLGGSVGAAVGVGGSVGFDMTFDVDEATDNLHDIVDFFL